MLDGIAKLQYLVELANKATTLPKELRTKDRLIEGIVLVRYG